MKRGTPSDRATIALVARAMRRYPSPDSAQSDWRIKVQAFIENTLADLTRERRNLAADLSYARNGKVREQRRDQRACEMDVRAADVQDVANRGQS